MCCRFDGGRSGHAVVGVTHADHPPRLDAFLSQHCCVCQVCVYHGDLGGFGFQLHAEARSRPPAAAGKDHLENSCADAAGLLLSQLFSKRWTT